MDSVPMVEMIKITKRFPGVIANNQVTFTARAGEIHALLGENGAGKSTLMSVLTGLYRPDSGEIKINGRKAEFLSPKDAVLKGIGMVHQHFKLVKPFTVTENIMLGLKGLKQIYNLKALEAEVFEFSKKYGLAIDPRAKIWQLSVGEQQRVEIVKMLFKGAEILILDEPTAVLTPQEADDLYKNLRSMANDGKTIIVISHKMNEVLKNTDYITVLRDGKLIGTVKTESTNEDELAKMMVGRDLTREINRGNTNAGPKVLELKNVSAFGDRGWLTLKDVSLEVCGGEILGIAGVAGNGQRDLAEIIGGVRKVESGQIYINQKDFTGLACRSFINAGVGYIPEDRMTTGLIPNLNTFENIVLKSYRRLNRWFINWSKIRHYANELISRFEIKMASPYYPVKSMSGGNLQKLLVSREIATNPNLIVAVYPMRGLDIGATESIKKLLLTQKSSGKAVLLISEELDELFELADRIAVIHAGEIMGIVTPMNTSIETVGMMMAGKRMECNAG